MEYYGSIATAWSKQNGSPREETEVFEVERRAHEAIQRRLNELYPGKWMYISNQYVHVDGRASDDTIATIRTKLSRVEALERDIKTFEHRIAEYQASLDQARRELELAKADNLAR